MGEHNCIQNERLNRIENDIEKVERKVDKLFKEDNEQKVFITKLEMSLQQVIKLNENIENYIRESQITFQKINDNLDKLNTKSEKTDTKLEEVSMKVDKLADDFDKAESKNLVVVDQRLLIKKILGKYVLPIGGLAAIVLEVLNLLGVFNK